MSDNSDCKHSRRDHYQKEWWKESTNEYHWVFKCLECKEEIDINPDECEHPSFVQTQGVNDDDLDKIPVMRCIDCGILLDTLTAHQRIDPEDDPTR